MKHKVKQQGQKVENCDACSARNSYVRWVMFFKKPTKLCPACQVIAKQMAQKEEAAQHPRLRKRIINQNS